jgi:ketosteroid isomerase-like protein
VWDPQEGDAVAVNEGRSNEDLIRRALDALTRGDVEGAYASHADDFVQEWPQSGERVVGRAACLVISRNYPGGPPKIEIQRMWAAGDLVIAETTLDYGTDRYIGAHVFEIRDGQIARQVDYFATPFPPPAWRSQWVQLTEPVPTSA